MRQVWAALLLAAVVAAALPAAMASASGPRSAPGDIPTLLFPVAASPLRVESLALDYRLEADGHARVTARYVIANPTEAELEPALALGWFTAARAGRERGLMIALDGDGPRPMEAAGVLAPERIAPWQGAIRQVWFRNWGAAGPLLDSFPVRFGPGQAREVVLTYVQQAGLVTGGGANGTHQLDLLLEPAGEWGGFGPITLQVEPAEPSQVSSPLPVGEAEPLPASALLSVQVMPTRGMVDWIADYRGLFAHTLGWGALALGLLAGWSVGRARGWVLAAWVPLLLVGGAVALWGIAWLVGALFPVDSLRWTEPYSGMLVLLAYGGYLLVALVAGALVWLRGTVRR